MHKMNKQIEPYCPYCSQKETIRHCIYLCPNSQEVWQTIKKIWEEITGERLPKMSSNEWIINEFDTQYTQELQEINNIVSHQIWINRNKRIFGQTKTTTSVIPLILTIAQIINIHIRAQLYKNISWLEQDLKPKATKWGMTWERIKNLSTGSLVIEKLQTELGTEALRQWLYNYYTLPEVPEPRTNNDNQIAKRFRKFIRIPMKNNKRQNQNNNKKKQKQQIRKNIDSKQYKITKKKEGNQKDKKRRGKQRIRSNIKKKQEAKIQDPIRMSTHTRRHLMKQARFLGTQSHQISFTNVVKKGRARGKKRTKREHDSYQKLKRQHILPYRNNNSRQKRKREQIGVPMKMLNQVPGRDVNTKPNTVNSNTVDTEIVAGGVRFPNGFW